MEIGSETVLPSSLYASMSRRFGAWFLDALFVGCFGLFAANVIPFVGGLIVWFFYAPIFEASALRATLGKYLMGIQVADLSGRRISFRQSLIRNLMKIVSTMILFIGYLFALFSSRKQALHDVLADTVVVYGRNEISIADAWVDETKALFRAGESTDAGFSQATTASGGGSAAGRSVAEELERLQALRDRGTLTAEEFEAAKKKLLS